jgi:hypothetical protein
MAALTKSNTSDLDGGLYPSGDNYQLVNRGIRAKNTSNPFDLDDTNFFGNVMGNHDLAEKCNEQYNSKTSTSLEPTMLKDNMMENPLFVSVVGGPLMRMTTGDIYSRFQRVIIASLNPAFTLEQLKVLMGKYVSCEDFKSLRNCLVFSEGPLKLIKLHKKNATIVEKHNLEKLSSMEFGNDEIVIGLYELTSDVAKLYTTSLYGTGYTFYQLFKIIILFQRYNGEKYGTSLKSNLSNCISKLKESDYWASEFNCGLNMTKEFENRSFTNQISKSSKFDGKNASELVKKIIENTGSSDYLQGLIENVYKKDSFIDVSTAARNNGKFKLYRIDDPVDLTKVEVTELFQVLQDDKIKYDLFNAFLLSKNYCHLVVNNGDILDIMDDTIKKFMPLYKILFGYAWLCLSMEEGIKKTMTNSSDRYIFSLDDANKLPNFPYAMEDIHSSPYSTLLVSKDVINAGKNCIGLGQIKNAYPDQNKLSTLLEFTNKFNIFTSGDPNKSIFEGLETNENGGWKDFSVTGSVLTACIQHESPLVGLVANNVESGPVDRYLRFFNEYYKTSDIDIVSSKTNVFEFIDSVSKLYEIVVKNYADISGKTVDDVRDLIGIVPHKSLRFGISPEYIKYEMKDHKLDNVIDNLNDPEILEYFYFEYGDFKRRINKKLAHYRKKNKLFGSFFKQVDQNEMHLRITMDKYLKSAVKPTETEQYIYFNDIAPDDEKIADKDDYVVLKLSESIKFKIESVPNLKENEILIKRGLEVFQSRYAEQFSLISRFHLPFVRAYFCGNDVKLTPSAISGYKTWNGGDYKYITGKWDPTSIINKYRCKGLGVYLSALEIMYSVEKNRDSDEWKHVFNIGDTSQGVSNHLGYRKLNDCMFKPGVYEEGIPEDAYSSVEYEYIETMQDLYDVYKERFGYDPAQSGIDLLKFKTIRDDGTVRPFNKALLEVVYDMMK